MREFLEDGKTGLIVKQNLGEGIASALDKLINLSMLNSEELRANCREWVQTLNWQTVVEKHLELYQESLTLKDPFSGE